MQPNFKEFFHTNDALQTIYKSLEHIKTRKPHLQGEKFMADFLLQYKFPFPLVNKNLDEQGASFKVNRSNIDLFNNVFYSHIKSYIETDLRNTITNANNFSIRQEINSTGITIKILSQTELYSVENVYDFYVALGEKDEAYEADHIRYLTQYVHAIQIEMSKML